MPAIVQHALLLLGGLVCAVRAAEPAATLADLERLSALGQKAPESLIESIFDRIGPQSTNLATVLLGRIDRSDLGEPTLGVYVWALGLCQDRRAVPALVRLADRAKAEPLKKSCFKALAAIGGQQSGDYLLARLEQTGGKPDYFDVLNLLAEMQFGPALPRAVELLDCNPRTEYWRPVLIFCKMGDQAVPLLLECLADRDWNVRANAAAILGQWLLAPEALGPLRERYWKEKDRDVRESVFKSITATASDRQYADYLKEVIAREKDQRLLEGATNGLATFAKEREGLLTRHKKRRPSPAAFQKEYTLLYRSFGKKGNYEALDKASAPSDEPALKKLRERILQRNNDAAFDDYRRASKIIWLNRFFGDLK